MHYFTSKYNKAFNILHEMRYVKIYYMRYEQEYAYVLTVSPTRWPINSLQLEILNQP